MATHLLITGVAGAVLKTPLSFFHFVGKRPDILRECSTPYACHMLHVMCHMSYVTCHIFWDKAVRLVDGGSVMNRAPSIFHTNFTYGGEQQGAPQS